MSLGSIWAIRRYFRERLHWIVPRFRFLGAAIAVLFRGRLTQEGDVGQILASWNDAIDVRRWQLCDYDDYHRCLFVVCLV